MTRKGYGIGAKVLAAVGVAAATGLLALGIFYNFEQERSIFKQNEERMNQVADTVIHAIESIMLAGHAELVHDFAKRLQTVTNVETFTILRTDGSEAFLDNKTMDEVNERRGNEDFIPRTDEQVRRPMSPDDPLLRKVLSTKDEQIAYMTNQNGLQSLVFLHPLMNQSACHKCHGKANPIRGVVLLSTSLEPVWADIRTTRLKSLMILTLAMILILLITRELVRRGVVQRVQKITTGMARVAAGKLDEKVPERGNDELSEMARSFNVMTRGLLDTYDGLHQEQNKLQTVIRSAREGAVVTDSAGHVAIVNTAAEQLLGKSSERIINEGFLNIFDDPDQMQAWLESPLESAEEVEFKGRILLVNAATIRTDDGQVLGSAALIRDVTVERKITAELNRISLTDELTGMWNRRHLDQTLAREWERAQRYKRSFGAIMIDIDHFKRFNDEHGHEQGDNVLRAVGQCVMKTVRNADVACRYGGEELTVILPETDAPTSLLVAERVRRAVEALEVDGLKVTVSIGVAAYPETPAASPDEVIKASDAALYAAKQAGRNRVASSARPSPSDAPRVVA